MYRRSPDVEIEHSDGSITNYNLEVAWLEGRKVEMVVVSESPNNLGPPARSCEIDIAEQIAAQTGQELKEVTLYIEQADGKYLYRTFRGYQVDQSLEIPGERPRIVVEVDYEDRGRGLFTRQEVEQYMAQAEIPQERRLTLDNAQQYDLSNQYFDAQNRLTEQNQTNEQSRTIELER